MTASHGCDITDACIQIDDLFHLDELMRFNYNILYGSAFDSRRTGSSIEGAVICKLLKATPEFEEDSMHELGMLPEDDVTNILEGVINKIGYYRIRTKELISVQPNFETIITKYSKEYLDLTFFSEIFGPIIHKEEGGPSLSFGMKINPCSYSFYHDVVPCFILPKWPIIIQPWFHRRRFWPSTEIIKVIKTSSCYLVCKKISQQEKQTWRLSFSSAELVLSTHMNNFQRKCYMLAKCLFYRDLYGEKDVTTGKQLSSYLLKTCMYFLLEETPTWEWIVLEKRNCYMEVVFQILDRFKEALVESNLPCYFLLEMNLLEGFSKKFIGHIIGKLHGMYYHWPLNKEVFYKRIVVFSQQIKASSWFIKGYFTFSRGINKVKIRTAIQELPKLLEEERRYIPERDLSFFMKLLQLDFENDSFEIFTLQCKFFSGFSDEWATAVNRLFGIRVINEFTISKALALYMNKRTIDQFNNHLYSVLPILAFAAIGDVLKSYFSKSEVDVDEKRLDEFAMKLRKLPNNINIDDVIAKIVDLNPETESKEIVNLVFGIVPEQLLKFWRKLIEKMTTKAAPSSNVDFPRYFMSKEEQRQFSSMISELCLDVVSKKKNKIKKTE